jgi:hypothetical protein
MTFKRYVLCWTDVGAAIPILVAITSLFMPKPPDINPFDERRPTPRERKIAFVATVLYPAFVVDEVLSMVETQRRQCGISYGMVMAPADGTTN